MKTTSAILTTTFVLCVMQPFAQNKISTNTPLPKQKLWLLNGNKGTDAAVNFLGTTDAQPLVFRVNNQQAGYLDCDSISANTGFGYGSLKARKEAYFSGMQNSAFGYQTLYKNLNGFANTAIGDRALYSNTGGYGNIAVGTHSLFLNTHGWSNAAIGYGTLRGNTRGYLNTVFGHMAMFSNTDGNQNCAIGDYALCFNTTGYFNTAVGHYASSENIDLVNTTTLGAYAYADANNKVVIGNSSVNSIGGAVGWTSYSDERIKNNVKENVPGLAFIKQLRPVTYHFSVARENELLGKKDTAQWEGKYDIEKINFTGLIAQDVDAAAKKLNYDFSGVDKTGKIWGLRYGDFVVPLVKAVQELSQQNDELKNELNDLKNAVQALQMQQSVANNNASQINKTGVTENNFATIFPNPANTILNIGISGNHNGGTIKIFDAQSRVVITKTLTHNTIQVDVSNLAPGTYFIKIEDAKGVELYKDKFIKQ